MQRGHVDDLPAFLAVAMSREGWQLKGLDSRMLSLLEEVDEKGEIEASGSVAAALEKSLLVHAEQVHTEKGSHAKILKTWKKWMKAAVAAPAVLNPDEARESLEKLLAHLNSRYAGRGTLPWRKR